MFALSESTARPVEKIRSPVAGSNPKSLLPPGLLGDGRGHLVNEKIGKIAPTGEIAA